MEEETLSIIQWNCRSIKKNVDRNEELKNLLHTRRPHVCCISETWLDEQVITPNFKGYSITYRKDRLNREGGGLIMLIRDDVKTKNIRLNIDQDNKIEAQAIKLMLKHEKIKLLHLYNPGEFPLDIEHFSKLIDQIGRKYITVGDMNGHHTLWDPHTVNNQCGNALSDYLLEKPSLVLATEPGLATHTNSTHNKK